MTRNRARGNFCPHPPPRPGHAARLLAAAAAPALAAARTAYNARMDRLDAIRLLQALVAAGANTRAPMASAWVDKIAVRDMELHGTGLASAIAYAEGQRWLAHGRTREDWIYLTRLGQLVAKESVS